MNANASSPWRRVDQHSAHHDQHGARTYVQYQSRSASFSNSQKRNLVLRPLRHRLGGWHRRAEDKRRPGAQFQIRARKSSHVSPPILRVPPRTYPTRSRTHARSPRARRRPGGAPRTLTDCPRGGCRRRRLPWRRSRSWAAGWLSLQNRIAH